MYIAYWVGHFQGGAIKAVFSFVFKSLFGKFPPYVSVIKNQSFGTHVKCTSGWLMLKVVQNSWNDLQHALKINSFQTCG